MAYKRRRSSKVVSEIFNFQDVVNKHIDRLNYIVAQDSEPGFPTIQKAVTLVAMVKQLENQLSFLLEDDYLAILKERIHIPPVTESGDPESYLQFFEKLSDWQQLLFAYAYTKKLIKTPLEYDEFVEEAEEMLEA